MDNQDKEILQRIANTVRVLAAEGVERAVSGHPGLPMGCAELGAYLFTRTLRYNPKNPNWAGRDRLVLSAGHGSMWLYLLLHLSGYDVTMEDIKSFRRLNSRTPGHPEYGETAGVETTTGPLGQGVAQATGMALAQKLLAARFGEELFDSKVFVLAGDGDMMEGISSEASSLAGHLRLNNLILMYDSNNISLDGPTSENLTEDTGKRYQAYGFRVLTIDGYDFDAMEKALKTARAERRRPTLIIVKTIIGKGSPNKQGSNASHGAALGKEEVRLVKQGLGWPDEEFYVPPEVYAYFQSLQPEHEKLEKRWNAKVRAMKRKDPEKGNLWDIFDGMKLPADFDDQLWAMAMEPTKATRNQGQKMIAKVAEMVPYFVTGSADLSTSDESAIKGAGVVTADNFAGRTFKFGVREFAMASACTGMALSHKLQPLCATFFTFSDYMRNAIRLSALMGQRVFYQFTHDSVWLGEDGPTHQPIGQLASLRAMPGLTVIRPCDGNETKAAWIQAFKAKGPVAFILTRQVVRDVSALTGEKARDGVARGAYILYGTAEGNCDVVFFATGSEVGLAVDAAKLLEGQGKTVRVISMPSWELFEAQDEAYKASILDGNHGLRVSIEAGVQLGWHKYIGRKGLAISIDRFGASAPFKDLFGYFGFTPEKVVERILNKVKS